MVKTSARKNRACPVCLSNKKTNFFHKKFAKFKESFDFSYDLVVCEVCGGIYANKIADQKQYDKYYAELSKYEDSKGQGRVTKEMTTSHKRIIKLVQNFAGNKKVSIIDIGSASGDLLNEFREEGFADIFGFDPSSACRDAAKKDFDIELGVATINSYQSKKKFDVAILSHVLEHIIDIESAMGKIRKILKPSGLLYVEVPASDKFAQKSDGFYEHFSIEHVNYFSRQTLKMLMERLGFKQVYSRTSLNKTGFYPVFPVIRSLWEVAPKPKRRYRVKKDTKLIKSLHKYIGICTSKVGKINQKIDKIVASQEKIIIWGAGSHTLAFLSNTELAKANIEAVVDDTKSLQGKRLVKFLIQAPEKILPKSQSPILISSADFQEAIARRITLGLGLKNKIIRLYSKT